MNRKTEHGTTPPDGKPQAEQPYWRHDFPIDMKQDEYISRRDFTRFMVLISSAFAVGQVWIVAQNYVRRCRGLPPVQAIARMGELEVGKYKIFHYPTETDPCVLVRLSEKKFIAYDQACTHLSCPLIPLVNEGRFDCPCHKGSFDMESGRPLYGPPRRSLKGVNLEIVGDQIFAKGYV